MSLRDLARRAQVSAGWLSRIERGLAGADDELIFRLAKALAVSPSDITQGGSPMASAAKEATRTVPYPGTPGSEYFHYSPEEAARFLPWSALQLKRKAYAREVPHNEGGSRVTFTGRDICEISQMTAVRPLSETAQLRSS